MANELRVDPEALLGRHKYRRDKAERMASVLEGATAALHGARAPCTL